jgi:hypothetical protein
MHEGVMTKRIVLTGAGDIEHYRERVRLSAEQTRIELAKLLASAEPLEAMSVLKFENLGCDPLNPSRRLNVIEQINQTLTYLASLDAAQLLFEWHPGSGSLCLNLGTESGSDIESQSSGLIAAEVFAAVSPKNNKKLAKDIVKVSKVLARHRYVFFRCPSHEGGPYHLTKDVSGVTIWSLGRST